MQYEIYGKQINGVVVEPFGTYSTFDGNTADINAIFGIPCGNFLSPGWCTTYGLASVIMPAMWNIQWSNHPSTCYDLTTPPPYSIIPPTYQATLEFDPDVQKYNPLLDSKPSGAMYVGLPCITNTPLTEDFVPTAVNPQFALDDQLPTSIHVSAFDAINAGPSATTLNVFSTSLATVAQPTATSVDSNGMGAQFPYPSLPAGAYITTITTSVPGSPTTTNGMQPFYIAHDDTSYSSAFGVAVAVPQEIVTSFGAADIYGDGTCAGQPYSYTSTNGGNPIPLVTLPTRGQLAIGTSSNTVAVGTTPTVVIAYNDQEQDNYSSRDQRDQCDNEWDQITGAQSALVVNTGDNSVSLLDIGWYNYPTGTITVGSLPVAAAISPDETKAYIANYGDGTVSEIDLVNVQKTRTIAVMSHPASVTFDSNENLWVGGQGGVMKVNVSGWFVASSTPIDGTVNGMNYDTQKGVLVQTMLQNGNSASVAAGGTTGEGTEGTTGSNPIVFNTTPGLSYSTQNTFSVATLASATSTSSTVMGDNAAYAQSSIAPYLAFPGQLAFVPPIYSATNGDMTATVNGTSFTVSIVGTGEVLIQGTLPYPARSVALSSTAVYFTMPESNSLVSLPISISN
jgi:YVTN family beta-propeller protein